MAFPINIIKNSQLALKWHHSKFGLKDKANSCDYYNNRDSFRFEKIL